MAWRVLRPGLFYPRWRRHRNRGKIYLISLYVVGVIVVLVIINYIAWYVGGEARLKTFELLSGGFL